MCCEELGLVLDPVHIAACVCRPVVLYACVDIFKTFRRRCLLLALLFSPAVGPLFSPAVGLLFSPAVHSAPLDHRCGSAPEPRSCITSFWTSAFVFWLLVISFMFLSLLASRKYSLSSVLLRAA